MKELKYGSTVTFTKGKQYRVKIKGKVRKDTISLFLECYSGYEVKNGKNVPKVTKEYLSKNVLIAPKTAKEKKEYNDTLFFVETIRKNREQESEYRKEGLLNPNMQKINLISYLDNFAANYNKKDKRKPTNVVNTFKVFLGKEVLYPKELDKKMMLGYKDYLLSKYNGQTPNTYFACLSHILNKAVEDGVFIKSPAHGIHCKCPTGINKAILTAEEIQLLINTPIRSKGVRDAFLFCLNTGLRFADVNVLTYKSIVDKKLIIRQTKTNQQVVIDLNEMALSLIGERGEMNELIFKLPRLPNAITTVKKWGVRAGVKKNITWHSARHTFATLLLQNNANIRTVSSLLGHTTLNHTQKYLHLVDELKTEAVNSLPTFDMGKIE